MKEASYYKKLVNNKVQCHLCPHNCIIHDKKRGVCKVRENKGGKLYSLVYGKSISTNVDPIEKKPLYQFLPGKRAFSIGSAGCNLKCKQCQNFQMSQSIPEEFPGITITPEEIIEQAINQDCQIMSYTYNEPTIFYEYMIEIAKLAKKSGLKNTMVSNGFINKEPLNNLCKYLDAANIDLKSFDNDFYKKVCGARLNPVLDTLKSLKEKNIWIEITNLIIPTLNDDLKSIKKTCTWIKENLGTKYPLHFTAFYPCYKLTDLPSTNPDTLIKAREIAIKVGLEYVYTGNIYADESNNTYCPKCKKLIIERGGFSILNNNLNLNKCDCKKTISGIYE